MTGPSAFPFNGDAHPFVRFRELMDHAQWRIDVRGLDAAVAIVDGKGLRETPLVESPELATELGIARLWIKDETGNPGGSHKIRHLFGLALRAPAEAPFAIASCGNAALAAAIVAKASGHGLEVFVPPQMPAQVRKRLRGLGADIVECVRSEGDPPGDPCYRRFRERVREGVYPFCCQGSVNPWTIDGGRTLAWELVAQLHAAGAAPITRILVQVGGGALMSATVNGLRLAQELGAIDRWPRLHAVQAAQHQPLIEAWQRGEGHFMDQLADAPGDFMRPTAVVPQSVASGILDDETYDWLPVVRGMRESDGFPVAATEETLTHARDRGRAATGIDVSATGAAGLAGAMELAARGELGRDEHVAVLFTGVER